MNITFEILKSACKYTGACFKESSNCNHPAFAYSGEYDPDTEGHIIMSMQECNEKICPYLQERESE